MSRETLFGLMLLAVLQLGAAALVAALPGRGCGRRSGCCRHCYGDVYEAGEPEERGTPLPVAPAAPAAQPWHVAGHSFCHRENRTTPHLYRLGGTQLCLSCKHESVGGADA